MQLLLPGLQDLKIIAKNFIISDVGNGITYVSKDTKQIKKSLPSIPLSWFVMLDDND